MIFKWISNYLTKRRQRSALHAFKTKWGYNLQGSSHLTIGDAGIVSEYGYLLRYITVSLPGGAMDDFHDYQRISHNFSHIDAHIVSELQSDSPREARRVSLETARGNLRNLRLIVQCLSAYVEMALAVGLPPNPMKLSPESR